MMTQRLTNSVFSTVLPNYDSGDGVHSNDEGYRLMTEAVDINQLTSSSSRGV